MILLDTSAVVFLVAGHRRAKPLARHEWKLLFSPFVLLELQFLVESGRAKFLAADPVAAARADPRWTIDSPPLLDVIDRSLSLTWTRDPFDRLIAAHALARGLRLATSDALLLENLPAAVTLAI